MKTVKYITDIPEDVNDLLKEAAKRDGRSKNNFIQKLLKEAAEQEYAQQQCDDAKTDKE